MTYLTQQFEELRQKKASLEKDKESLIYEILESLNVNYKKENDLIEIKSAILFNGKEKEIKSFSIYFVDNENKHFFTDKPTTIFKFIIDSNLNIKFEQNFENKHNLNTLKKYNKIIKSFVNIDTSCFNFIDYHRKLSDVIHYLIFNKSELKTVKQEIDKQKFYSLKKEIEKIISPISDNDSFSMYKELTKKRKHKEYILFWENDIENNNIILRKELLKIDNTGRNIAIHLVSEDLERHRKIAKSRLREILSNQFLFKNNLIKDIEDVSFIKQIIQTKDNSYSILNILDLYNFLKPHINANLF